MNDRWESEDVAEKSSINQNEWKNFINFLNYFFDSSDDINIIDYFHN